MDKHILIVGAGASGIAAATRLMEAGYSNVTVLEAEQRIGGRVNTIPYGNGKIEMGAQFCHGEEGNVVYNLAKDHDLLESGEIDDDFLKSNGSELRNKRGNQLMSLMELTEMTEADAADASKVRRSMGDLITERYAEALLTDEFKKIHTVEADQFLRLMQSYYNVEFATDSWFEMSVQGVVDFHEYEGNDELTWKGDGYKNVFELLLRNIPDPAQTIPLESRIQFGRVVRNVDWSPENSQRRVECTDGSVYEADHVIVTVSLGILRKHHTTMFTPALPLAKVNAIEAHKLGAVEKLFLEFEQPFWEKDWQGFSTLWRYQELDELRLNPSDEWLSSLTAVNTVEYQPNMLCGWVAGENARKMSQLTEQQAKESLMRAVRMFVRDRPVPDPISFKRSQWSQEPNFLGAYSYQTVYAHELQATREDLADPLVHPTIAGGDVAGRMPVVQFAGEATIARRYGTVDGAIESGWREAERLIELYK